MEMRLLPLASAGSVSSNCSTNAPLAPVFAAVDGPVQIAITKLVDIESQ